MQSNVKRQVALAGKAGGFLALDWSDGRVTGPLSRRSFELHARLAEELPHDTGYRRVQTLSVAASAGMHRCTEILSGTVCCKESSRTTAMSWGCLGLRPVLEWCSVRDNSA
jgi:hypothetical protein